MQLPLKSLSRPSQRPIWVPPLVSVGTLFSLFLAATAVRRSPFADAVRPLMIALSTAAALAITLYGVKMLLTARVRGVASAVAGLVMVVLGIYTALHVLR
jgi:hypothetical protein